MGETTTFDAADPPLINVVHDYPMVGMSEPPVDGNSIQTFLSKPYRVTSGDWLASQPQLTVLTQFDPAYYLTFAPVWTKKLADYRYFRGTAVITVTLNALPFQAGKLLLSFLPQANQREASYLSAHNGNICTLTQQPNIEIDAKTKTAVFKVPFISPMPWYDLVDSSNAYGYGFVSLTVLSALTSVTTTIAKYAVFLHFEDIEVAGPVFIAEMGTLNRSTGTRVKAERKNVAKSGFISGTLDALSGSMSALSTAASSSGDAAAALGWSRPLDPTPATVVQHAANRQTFNFNTPSVSASLSMDALNSVTPLSQFGGTSVDEMSFDYLKKIPAYINSFYLNTADTEGSLVFTQFMSPSYCTYPHTAGSNRVLAGPPFAYLSRFFQYYRGGVRLHFKFVKTQYHTGRILISYNAKVTITSTISATQPLLREVVDLSVADEVCLDIPYISDRPYTETGWFLNPDAQSISFGAVMVNILDPLVSATTVASYVHVLVYASALDDFELMKPIPSDTFMTCEMGYAEDETQDGLCKVIGGYPLPSSTIVPANACAGEVFTSIKQLVLMPRQLKVRTGWIANQPSAAFMGLPFYPFVLGCPAATGVTEVYDAPFFGFDYLSELAQGFAYSRGGVRIIVPSQSSSYGTTTAWIDRAQATSTIQGAVVLNENSLMTTVARGTSPGNLAPQIVRSEFGGKIDVTVPHSSAAPFRLNVQYLGNSNGVIPYRRGDPKVYFYAFVNYTFSTSTVDSAIYRSGADDYAFGYFIGFPSFSDCRTA